MDLLTGSYSSDLELCFGLCLLLLSSKYLLIVASSGEKQLFTSPADGLELVFAIDCIRH